jgi:hypothetical protein
MITKIYTIEQLKSLIAELFYNKTTRVTAASDESVINALFFGAAKVGQKAMKDIALVESHLFPQYAYGAYLDDVALLYGAPTRFSTTGSSAYLLIKAVPGTTYEATTHTFTGENGITFELVNDFTVGSIGYGYVKVRSIESGKKTNVDANTITKVVPIPTGHIGVTNEFRAIGGRDVESDDDFRLRIIQHPNILSQKTLLYMTNILREFNSDILRVLNYGYNDDAKLTFAIVMQSGEDLSQSELASLLDYITDYLAISDLSPDGNDTGVVFQNPIWFPIGGDEPTDSGVDFRVQIYENYDPEEVRKNIQIALSNKYNFKYWDWSSQIEWDDLLGIVKSVEGVRYVPDSYFHPHYDITVPQGYLPRVKKFIMRDLSGTIIFSSNTLAPIYYSV